MSFSSKSIEHCNRDANQVAHELAKFSFINRSTCFWANEPHRFLIAIMANNVILFNDQ
jgi:hypothetical protein